MLLKKLYILVFLLISACSSSDNNTRYQDMTPLEQPPVMNVVSPPKIQNTEVEKISEKGLDNKILLDKTTSILKITKSFSRSWEIVSQALVLNKIKVKDKNRKLGVFYVTYDPDDFQSEDVSMMDKMTFFLFKDDYEEMDYQLTLVADESETKISVKQIDKDINDLLDDGKGYVEGTIDTGEKLIEALYKTIKQDLSEK